MDTFLITGAMGFVGSHLAEALLRGGKTVWGIDLAEPEYRDELLSYRNFHFVLDTIKNEEALVKLIDKADCVCHLAAIANPATYVENPHKVMDITMQVGIRVAELAQLREKLFFYTSTSEVYGRNPKVPWAESDDRILGATTINRWCYATAKAAVDTHGQSPWHFTGQAKLDLNAHFAIISIRANPITSISYPYVSKTHSGILIHPRA